MPQAKGVLPRRDDREVLYKNPQTCGYFVAVRLDPGMDRAALEAWLDRTSGLVDALVAREPAAAGQDKGRKVAAVAVGLAPRFFALPGAAGAEPPASFAPGMPLPTASGPLSQAPALDADALFYVASVQEARVHEFVTALAAPGAGVVASRMERGYPGRRDRAVRLPRRRPQRPAALRPAPDRVRPPRRRGRRRARVGRRRVLPRLRQDPAAA